MRGEKMNVREFKKELKQSKEYGTAKFFECQDAWDFVTKLRLQKESLLDACIEAYDVLSKVKGAFCEHGETMKKLSNAIAQTKRR
jgi:hypothetical protein